MSVSFTDHGIERVEGTVMPVNSYLIDGPRGLVVVDGQLTVTDARAVRRRIDELGRPVAGMVLTHGHPDHYAGAAIILDGLDVPILATAGVADVVSRDDAEKDGIVGPMMGPEWPTERRFVDEIVEPGARLQLGGTDFTVRELGPGESGADSIWSLDDATHFTGDVAYNDMHAYLFDGHFGAWLALLHRLDAEIDHDATLYVGHGRPVDKAVLGRQVDYVETFIDAVSANLDRDEAGRHDAVVARMAPLVGDDRLSFLMELSIEPAATILAGDSPR